MAEVKVERGGSGRCNAHPDASLRRVDAGDRWNMVCAACGRVVRFRRKGQGTSGRPPVMA